MAACQSNRSTVVSVLVRTDGVDLDIVCGTMTALHLAAKHQDCKCLKALLSAGASVCQDPTRNDETEKATKEQKSKQEGDASLARTPLLSVAAQFGNQAGVEMLIEYDAPVDEKDLNGVTALMASVQKKQLKCATFIIKNCKPDVNVRDRQGNTVLDSITKAIRMCPQQGSARRSGKMNLSRSPAMSYGVEITDVYQELHDFKEFLQHHGAKSGPAVVKAKAEKAEKAKQKALKKESKEVQDAEDGLQEQALPRSPEKGKKQRQLLSSPLRSSESAPFAPSMLSRLDGGNESLIKNLTRSPIILSRSPLLKGSSSLLSLQERHETISSFLNSPKMKTRRARMTSVARGGDSSSSPPRMLPAIRGAAARSPLQPRERLGVGGRRRRQDGGIGVTEYSRELSSTVAGIKEQGERQRQRTRRTVSEIVGIANNDSAKRKTRSFR